jgi:hypothetical protein
MPKKDTASAVLGMLSSAGAETRPAPTVEPTPVAESGPSRVEPSPAPRPSASVSTLPPIPAPEKAVDTAPRTLRLRADTAQRLRDAWLEAKRDDVLLTAQDFASALVEEALVRRRRQRSANSI